MNDRVVEPFSFTANMIDVWAYDVEKADSRVFKVSRVGTVEALVEEYPLAERDLHREDGKWVQKI